MDIPFIRFAFPLLILYSFWYTLIENPWTGEMEAAAANPNTLTEETAQLLLAESRDLVNKGQFEAAMTPTRRLHAAYPENQIYIQMLAQIFERLARDEEAVGMWEKYMVVSPTPIEACPNIGILYQKLGKRDQAFKAFERCWQIDERDADTNFFYAHALEMRGQLDRALELYSQAAKYSPNYTDLLLGIARVETRLGHPGKARPIVDGVLKRNPENVDALLVSGVLSLRAGDRATAVKVLERARQLSPRYEDVAALLDEARGSRKRTKVSR